MPKCSILAFVTPFKVIGVTQSALVAVHSHSANNGSHILCGTFACCSIYLACPVTSRNAISALEFFCGVLAAVYSKVTSSFQSVE
jgi:hypothetical protein